MSTVAMTTAILQYLFVICLIAVAGVVGVVFQPEQAAPIFAFCGSIAVGVVAVLMKVTEMNHTVNSKMDQLLKLKGESEHAKGVLAGRAKQKEENHGGRD